LEVFNNIEDVDSFSNLIINCSISPFLSKDTIKDYLVKIDSLKRDMLNGDINLKLNPMWVTGITDGEGNFSVNIQKGTNKPKINLTFKIDQKEDSAGILYDLSRYFNSGKVVIDNRGYKSFKVVKLADILNIIIPHFDKFPLITSKQLNFLDFKKIAGAAGALRLLDKNDLDINKIESTINNMNSRRSFVDKWNYLSNSKLIKLDPHWIQAFIDGEGSFQFGIADRISRGSTYIATTPTLEIAQNTHDILVLNLIKQFFEAGYLKPKFNIFNLEEALSVRSVSRFVLRDSRKIIEFIDKYPMLTRKHEDYLKWKTLVLLKDSRAFDSTEGRSLMEYIKTSMNKGKYNNLDEKEISENNTIKRSPPPLIKILKKISVKIRRVISYRYNKKSYNK
jgi:hypothetical protein